MLSSTSNPETVVLFVILQKLQGILDKYNKGSSDSGSLIQGILDCTNVLISKYTQTNDKLKITLNLFKDWSGGVAPLPSSLDTYLLKVAESTAEIKLFDEIFDNILRIYEGICNYSKMSEELFKCTVARIDKFKNSSSYKHLQINTSFRKKIGGYALLKRMSTSKEEEEFLDVVAQIGDPKLLHSNAPPIEEEELKSVHHVIREICNQHSINKPLNLKEEFSLFFENLTRWRSRQPILDLWNAHFKRLGEYNSMYEGIDRLSLSSVFKGEDYDLVLRVLSNNSRLCVRTHDLLEAMIAQNPKDGELRLKKPPLVTALQEGKPNLKEEDLARGELDIDSIIKENQKDIALLNKRIALSKESKKPHALKEGVLPLEGSSKSKTPDLNFIKPHALKGGVLPLKGSSKSKTPDLNFIIEKLKGISLKDPEDNRENIVPSILEFIDCISYLLERCEETDPLIDISRLFDSYSTTGFELDELLLQVAENTAEIKLWPGVWNNILRLHPEIYNCHEAFEKYLKYIIASLDKFKTSPSYEPDTFKRDQSFLDNINESIPLQGLPGKPSPVTKEDLEFLHLVASLNDPKVPLNSNALPITKKEVLFISHVIIELFDIHPLDEPLDLKEGLSSFFKQCSGRAIKLAQDLLLPAYLKRCTEHYDICGNINTDQLSLALKKDPNVYPQALRVLLHNSKAYKAYLVVCDSDNSSINEDLHLILEQNQEDIEQLKGRIKLSKESKKLHAQELPPAPPPIKKHSSELATTSTVMPSTVSESKVPALGWLFKELSKVPFENMKDGSINTRPLVEGLALGTEILPDLQEDAQERFKEIYDKTFWSDTDTTPSYPEFYGFLLQIAENTAEMRWWRGIYDKLLKFYGQIKDDPKYSLKLIDENKGLILDSCLNQIEVCRNHAEIHKAINTKLEALFSLFKGIYPAVYDLASKILDSNSGAYKNFSELMDAVIDDIAGHSSKNKLELKEVMTGLEDQIYVSIEQSQRDIEQLKEIIKGLASKKPHAPEEGPPPTPIKEHASELVAVNEKSQESGIGSDRTRSITDEKNLSLEESKKDQSKARKRSKKRSALTIKDQVSEQDKIPLEVAGSTIEEKSSAPEEQNLVPEETQTNISASEEAQNEQINPAVQGESTSAVMSVAASGPKTLDLGEILEELISIQHLKVNGENIMSSVILFNGAINALGDIFEETELLKDISNSFIATLNGVLPPGELDELLLQLAKDIAKIGLVYEIQSNILRILGEFHSCREEFKNYLESIIASLDKFKASPSYKPDTYIPLQSLPGRPSHITEEDLEFLRLVVSLNDPKVPLNSNVLPITKKEVLLIHDIIVGIFPIYSDGKFFNLREKLLLFFEEWVEEVSEVSCDLHKDVLKRWGEHEDMYGNINIGQLSSALKKYPDAYRWALRVMLNYSKAYEVFSNLDHAITSDPRINMPTGRSSKEVKIKLKEKEFISQKRILILQYNQKDIEQLEERINSPEKPHAQREVEPIKQTEWPKEQVRFPEETHALKENRIKLSKKKAKKSHEKPDIINSSEGVEPALEEKNLSLEESKKDQSKARKRSKKRSALTIKDQVSEQDKIPSEGVNSVTTESGATPAEQNLVPKETQTNISASEEAQNEPINPAVQGGSLELPTNSAVMPIAASGPKAPALDWMFRELGKVFFEKTKDANTGPLIEEWGVEEKFDWSVETKRLFNSYKDAEGRFKRIWEDLGGCCKKKDISRSAASELDRVLLQVAENTAEIKLWNTIIYSRLLVSYNTIVDQSRDSIILALYLEHQKMCCNHDKIYKTIERNLLSSYLKKANYALPDFALKILDHNSTAYKYSSEIADAILGQDPSKSARDLEKVIATIEKESSILEENQGCIDLLNQRTKNQPTKKLSKKPHAQRGVEPIKVPKEQVRLPKEPHTPKEEELSRQKKREKSHEKPDIINHQSSEEAGPTIEEQNSAHHYEAQKNIAAPEEVQENTESIHHRIVQHWGRPWASELNANAINEQLEESGIDSQRTYSGTEEQNSSPEEAQNEPINPTVSESKALDLDEMVEKLQEISTKLLQVDGENIMPSMIGAMECIKLLCDKCKEQQSDLFKDIRGFVRYCEGGSLSPGEFDELLLQLAETTAEIGLRSEAQRNLSRFYAEFRAYCREFEVRCKSVINSLNEFKARPSFKNDPSKRDQLLNSPIYERLPTTNAEQEFLFILTCFISEMPFSIKKEALFIQNVITFIFNTHPVDKPFSLDKELLSFFPRQFWDFDSLFKNLVKDNISKRGSYYTIGEYITCKPLFSALAKDPNTYYWALIVLRNYYKVYEGFSDLAHEITSDLGINIPTDQSSEEREFMLAEQCLILKDNQEDIERLKERLRIVVQQEARGDWAFTFTPHTSQGDTERQRLEEAVRRYESLKESELPIVKDARRRMKELKKQIGCKDSIIEEQRLRIAQEQENNDRLQAELRGSRSENEDRNSLVNQLVEERRYDKSIIVSQSSIIAQLQEEKSYNRLRIDNQCSTIVQLQEEKVQLQEEKVRDKERIDLQHSIIEKSQRAMSELREEIESKKYENKKLSELIVDQRQLEQERRCTEGKLKELQSLVEQLQEERKVGDQAEEEAILEESRRAMSELIEEIESRKYENKKLSELIVNQRQFEQERRCTEGKLKELQSLVEQPQEERKVGDQAEGKHSIIEGLQREIHHLKEKIEHNSREIEKKNSRIRKQGQKIELLEKKARHYDAICQEWDKRGITKGPNTREKAANNQKTRRNNWVMKITKIEEVEEEPDTSSFNATKADIIQAPRQVDPQQGDRGVIKISMGR